MKNNVDISTYLKLTEFLKKQSVGYKPKKTQVFSKYEIPNTKTESELLTVNCIGNCPDKMNSGFNIVEIYRKYAALRPKNVPHRQFFLQYKNGKSTIQVVGINQFSKVPSLIAAYLRLALPEGYTDHSLKENHQRLY
ncbi:hypothetical protein BDFB_010299 [Asbolus verrucosus]|uniref:Uncharacterized protein n=1 Tax=Asbolus verrucosus TaxID=1661398 RepID=A0A482VFM2_ASBVE|nr:hypothetical protein BDFB_010299 [Asbolus verrucosus]